MPLLDDFIRRAAASLFLQAAGPALMLILFVVLARGLTLADYGLLVYVLALCNVLALAARLGLDRSVMRFTAEYVALGELGRLRGLISFSFWVTVGTGFVIFLLAAISAFYVAQPSQRLMVFLAAGWLIPIITVGAVWQASLLGLHKTFWALFPDNLIRPSVALALTLLAVWIGDDFSPVFAASILVAATFISTSIAGIILFVEAPDGVWASKRELQAPEWIRVSLPMMLIAGSYFLLTQIDVLMVGALLDASSAGIYHAAARLANVVALGLIGVQRVAAPKIAELFAVGDILGTQDVLKRSAFFATFFAAAMLVALGILGDLALSFFGPEFTNAKFVLMILLVGVAFNALTGANGALLSMTGYEKQQATIMSIAAVLNASLNFLLIPKYGLIGAGLATSSSIVFWNLSMAIFAYRKLGLKTWLNFRSGTLS